MGKDLLSKKQTKTAKFGGSEGRTADGQATLLQSMRVSLQPIMKNPEWWWIQDAPVEAVSKHLNKYGLILIFFFKTRLNFLKRFKYSYYYEMH